MEDFAYPGNISGPGVSHCVFNSIAGLYYIIAYINIMSSNLFVNLWKTLINCASINLLWKTRI
mgnify:FL=1